MYDGKLEITDARWCDDCEKVISVEEMTCGPLYECGGCGSKASGEEADAGRCDDCNRKRKRIGGEDCEVCPECDACELSTCAAIECPECGDIFEEESFEEHAKECLATHIRGAWAEDAVQQMLGSTGARVPQEAGPLEILTAVRCQCEELIEIDDYPEHAQTCEDTAGETDIVSEWVAVAIKDANTRAEKKKRVSS